MKFVSVVAAALILTALVWWTGGPGGDAEGLESAAVETVAVQVEDRTFDSPPAITPTGPTLWRMLGRRSSDVDPPPYEDGWSAAGRVLVEVSQAVAAARTWRVGGRVGVDIPQLGERYGGPIDRIEVGPAGSYELVGNGRLAWLLRSSSMMAGFDFGEPDYILPEVTSTRLYTERQAR